MENNLVELKYDRVNDYFEKFKKKYKEEYRNNKIKGTRVRHNYTTLFPGVFALFIVPSLLFLMNDLKPISTSVSEVWKISQLVNTMITPIVLMVGLALLLLGFVNFMKSSYEIEVTYTKKEYYEKIKTIMLDELRDKLLASITENMLIFDNDGLIVAPNLSTNENKKIFGEVERELKEYDK